MPTILDRDDWTARQSRYHARVADLLDRFRPRDGARNPVLDFLFTYYPVRPSTLRRWHPGYAVTLRDAPEFASRAGYEMTETGVTVTPERLAHKRTTIAYISSLLRHTMARPALFGCFGLHEWAMVYHTDERRHDYASLRLGRAGTDAVVESMPLRCTHFDAFRFFTPDAVPRNAELLTRDSALNQEQPGCLHASMDLYKWASKLGVLIASETLVDCFELAVAAREIDMRASPYDLSSWGYEPICIETAEGRREYVREQAAIAERGAPLRAQLADICDELLAHV